MLETAEKYTGIAEGYAERTYADPARLLGRRAELLQEFGPPLAAGDRVLDLACADAGIAPFLLDHGLEYRGLDANPAMVDAARRRVRGRAPIEQDDLNTYRPDEPVQATTCFNAIYYAADRRAFLRLVASYTEKKLVFDLNPRQFGLDTLRAEVRAAGFERLAARPFFVPQTYRLPGPVAAVLERLESTGLPARALLAVRFTYFCVAYR